MTNLLPARYYADDLVHRTVPLVENVQIARETWRARVDCPELAERITPGQFVMLRLTGRNDPLIGRPLALYDTYVNGAGNPQGLDVVYLVKGRFTTALAQCPAGTSLDVWGGLGNGFEPEPAQHLVMVAGGIGQTPFVAVAREALGLRTYGRPKRAAALAQRVTLCYGARTADLLAGVDDFRQLGVEVRIATDDGSRGHHGLVTELLEQLLRESTSGTQVVCCGPEPMMAAVARVAAQFQVPCRVSLETPMACGIGICFTCVAKVCDADGNWDYKRTCVEGPVFESARIVW